jgi:hypothetical protein
MGSNDYNSGGFTQNGNGAVFGDPSSDPGSIQDYNSWDWKQIEAAINGMSAGVDNAANQSHAQSVSSPQSLQDAANIFYQVQQVLSGVAQALTDQAKALAGDNGPWKGDAADSFLTMIDTFSKQVNATAAALSGGTSGADSVPQQLADNAVNLLNAQQKISEIDTYYANEAVKSGVTPMDNGLIPISKRPQLVEWMNEDMRAVLKSLAGEYQVTIDSVRSPGGINSPLGGSNQPSTGNGPDQPAYTEAGLTSTNPALSGLPASDLQAGTLTPDQLSAADTSALPLSAYNGSLGTGDSIGALKPAALNSGLNPAALDSTLNPSAYGGGTGTDGTGGLGAGGLGAQGLHALESSSPYGGGTGIGGTGALGNGISPLGLAAGSLPLSALGGALGTSGKGKLSTGSGLADSAFPGTTGVNGTGGLGSGGLGSAGDLSRLSTGDGLGTGARFPGTSLESGLPSTGDSAAGSALGTGEGMPYMPGMGGMSGQPSTGQGERSDASGLLDASGKPWAGATDLGAGIGNHLGTAAGGEGLTLPTEQPASAAGSTGSMGSTGEGMPYMPGMGGMSGQPNTTQGERSDASGLLAASAEPWAGDPGVGAEVGSGRGTAAGGEGLGLAAENTPPATTEETAATEQAAATEAAATEGAAAEGMPFLPGMGGTAAQPGAAQNGEGSDASGLLEAESDPWSGPPQATEPEAQHTAAGGEVLVLPGVVETPPRQQPAEAPAEQASAQAAVALTEEAAVWAAGTGTDEEAAFAEVELAAPVAHTAPAAPTGTGAPATGVGTEPGTESEEESTSAWDSAGASFVPLLWSVATEEEPEVLAPGYTAATEGTWGESPGPAAAPVPSEEEPRFATWRPNRTFSSPSSSESTVVYRSGAQPSYAVGEYDAEEADEEPGTEETEEPATASTDRAAADLLVQESDTWGVAADDDFGAII